MFYLKYNISAWILPAGVSSFLGTNQETPNNKVFKTTPYTQNTEGRNILKHLLFNARLNIILFLRLSRLRTFFECFFCYWWI